MKCLLVAVLASTSAIAAAQEREVPKDSARIAVQGCAKGRAFVVAPRTEHRSTTAEIPAGTRFRLSGPKDVLNRIKAHERERILLTGLVRRGQLPGQGGFAVAGGRVRIGGAVPRDPLHNDPARDPSYNVAVLDVEGWEVLPDSCPAR